MSDPSLEVLSPGRVFHRRYEVVRCLKSGGMGAIYEVIHLETRRRRALKIMLPSIVANPDMHARFKLEATVAADIESEHIVETFDAGVDKDTGAPFLVMELLRGEDLLVVLGKRKRLPPAEVVQILSQAASALDKTHAAGVVHRDLKPDNLFLTRRDDGSPKVKILDFGIAKVISESGQPAARTKILGTPLYMSPEQIRGDGDVGPRADLYALGHIAFALLTGEAYWTEEGRRDQLYALMMKIVAGAPEPATVMAEKYGAKLPKEFDAWFARAAASEPQQRFATATELCDGLAEVFGISAPRMSGPPTVPVAPVAVPPARYVPTPRLDAGGTRPLPEPVAPSEPTAVSHAGTSQPTSPLPQGLVASQPIGMSGEHAPRPRRAIAAVIAFVAVIAALAIGVRVVVTGPTASAPAEQPPPPAASAAAAVETTAVTESPAPEVVPTSVQPAASARSASSSATADPRAVGKLPPRPPGTPPTAGAQAKKPAPPPTPGQPASTRSLE